MPRARRNRSAAGKSVEALRHEQETRTNIPTAEYQSMVEEDTESPLRVAYQRRNRDLDPQLVWRGKDEQDLDDLVVNVPPLYIQEKVHPKVLIDDLLRQSRNGSQPSEYQVDMFADFNGLPEGADRTEFYRHEGYWQNRMVLGDSLQVMASLAEREGLQGKVQCIYIDPPYGIRFNSNFQWSTTSRDVRDGNRQHITREPEQVKAFRDTWRDGIHSYLTYLRDRLTVARDLLADSGSIFVQIGDENVHRVRNLLDEIFGEDNFVSLITIRKTTSEGASLLGSTTDFIIWYGKSVGQTKFRSMYQPRSDSAENRYSQTYIDGRSYRLDNITSSRPAGSGDVTSFSWSGRDFDPGAGTFKTTAEGLNRLTLADRIYASGRGKLNYRRFQDDFRVSIIGNLWADISGAVQSRSDPKVYVVQSSTQLVERCILMTTDPGDIVLDPTCGSGTTAYVAEQWGRRWITIDTSRVALALARARIMGARYPYYILADSRDGQLKEADISRRVASEMATYGNVRQGFVYERVPHITLRDIANNAEIDVIWEEYQEKLEPLREALNRALETAWEEWEIPRDSDESWSNEATELHRQWWEQRIARQREIDASIAARAEYEYLYDKPYEDRSRVRVAGPFTVESISPHRVLGVDENGDVIDGIAEARNGYGTGYDFGQIILDTLRRSGVQQAHREDRISFTSLTPWPGRFVCADGRYVEGGSGGDDEDAPARARAEGGGVHRAGVRHGVASRPRGGGAGGRRRRFRRAHRLCLQLRRPHNGVREPGEGAGAEGPHERRLAHGQRVAQHRQWQPVRHLRRAGHRRAGRRGRAGPGAGERRGRVPPQHGRGAQRRAGGHRLLVHRHRLQPGELLRPPRLLPGCRRSLQVAEDHPQGRNRRRRVGHAAQCRVAPVPASRVGPHSRQGHQPPGRRGHEGIPRGVVKFRYDQQQGVES